MNMSLHSNYIILRNLNETRGGGDEIFWRVVPGIQKKRQNRVYNILDG